jgi:hypothetical protein
MPTTFNLSPRSKAHTSPTKHDELKLLLALYQREEVHVFQQGRSLGHRSTNTFEDGFSILDSKKLSKYLTDTTNYIDILRFVCVSHSTTMPAPPPDLSPNVDAELEDHDSSGSESPSVSEIEQETDIEELFTQVMDDDNECSEEEDGSVDSEEEDDDDYVDDELDDF